MAANGTNGVAAPSTLGAAYPITDHTFDVVVVVKLVRFVLTHLLDQARRRPTRFRWKTTWNRYGLSLQPARTGVSFEAEHRAHRDARQTLATQRNAWPLAKGASLSVLISSAEGWQLRTRKNVRSPSHSTHREPAPTPRDPRGADRRR